MRFFHLSDLHIGLKLMNYDLYDEQRDILNKITTLAAEKKPDAVVIAGDIYDKSIPSAEAVELFDDFVTGLSAELPNLHIMMISGNHDSAQRVDCFRRVLEKQNIHMIGMPPVKQEDNIEKVVLKDAYGNVNFYLLPFVKPSAVKQITGVGADGNNLSYNDALHYLLEREKTDDNERNVIVSHQFYLPKGKKADEIERMDSEIRSVGNIDEVCADVLEKFDYAALGHIHKPMRVGSDTIRYCGTPIACSVSEAGQQKGIIMVDMQEKGTLTTSVLPLKPLHEVRIIKGSIDEILVMSCEDFVTVILTDNTPLVQSDIYDKLRYAFPRLLEIRRECDDRAEYGYAPAEEEILNPFELCCSFLPGTVDEEDKKIIKDILNMLSEEV